MVDRRWKYLVALPALGLPVAALAPGLARRLLGPASSPSWTAPTGYRWRSWFTRRAALRVSSAGRRLGGEGGDDVGRGTAVSVCGPLAARGGAVGQQRLAQLAHGLPVADVLQRRPGVVGQGPYHLGGRHRAQRDRVDQAPVQAGPGRPPAGGPQQDLRAVRYLEVVARGVGPRGGHHERPRERGQQDGVVDRGARVGYPDLDRRVPRGEPRVEVDHASVADHAALDQRGDGAVVLLGGREVGRRPDGRPAGHDDGPVRRVPGVAALEERGTGTHRQQYGQPGADPPGDPHGEIAVVHPDVHLAGAHLLLVDEVAVLRRHPFVPA